MVVLVPSLILNLRVESWEEEVMRTFGAGVGSSGDSLYEKV